MPQDVVEETVIRNFALASAAIVALAGCASTAEMRAMQTSQVAPTQSILFPSENEFRDAVVLDWIGGANQRSYVFQGFDQQTLRPLIAKALQTSGSQAGTPVRARYGLRVLVSDRSRLAIGGDANASMTATYSLIERSTGREIFRTAVRTQGHAVFIAPNERDFALAWDISARPTAQMAAIGAAGRVAQHNQDALSARGTDWSQFWDDWRAATYVAALLGPTVSSLNILNPNNYVSWASESETRHARESIDPLNDFQPENAARNGSRRGAEAIHVAAAENIAGFVLAFARDQHVEPMPILPCYGSPQVEAMKRDLMERGAGFRTDTCRARR